MLWAMFSTFLSSVSKVFFKKTTQYSIKDELNDLFWHFWAILGLLIMFIVWKLNFWLNNTLDYLLMFSTFMLFLLNMKLSMYVVSQETMSALIPFENLWKVLTVLFWVFLLNDQMSNTSLLMFMWVVILILFFSLDIKHLKFSKNMLLYCLAQMLNAMASLMIWYILLSNSSLDYYSVYTIMSLFFMLWVCWFMWLYWKMNWLNKYYFMNSGLSSLAWMSWLMSMLLIKELWLSVTTLLSFLGIWMSLLTSYMVFKDMPTKKNILLTLAMLSLVWTWYYFK